jgi:hypothetical protein
MYVKSVVFSYTNSELSGKEIQKAIPLMIVTTIENLGINLVKEMKGFCIENYKILMKEIQEDTKNEKKSCVHGLGESVLVNYPYKSK